MNIYFEFQVYMFSNERYNKMSKFLRDDDHSEKRIKGLERRIDYPAKSALADRSPCFYYL